MEDAASRLLVQGLNEFRSGAAHMWKGESTKVSRINAEYHLNFIEAAVAVTSNKCSADEPRISKLWPMKSYPTITTECDL